MPTGTVSKKDSSPTRRGRPIGDRDAKRAELLLAANKVIADEGYAGASLRKVAKQANYTTGAVTYYFANKDDMFAAVAESLFDEFYQLLEGDVENVEFRSIVESWLEWTSTHSDNQRVLFQMLAHARHEPSFGKIIQSRYARFRKLLTKLLEKGQQVGSVRNDVDAELLADQLSATGDGWMLALQVEPARLKPKRRKALVNLVMTLISPTG